MQNVCEIFYIFISLCEMFALLR